MAALKKISLTTWIFIAMLAGVLLGLLFGENMSEFKFIGTIWINMIKVIVVPLILCIMILTVAKQTDLKALGRIAIRILCYYIMTTIFASAISLASAAIFKPGVGLNLAGMEGSEVTGGGTFTVSAFFLSMFSDNMFGTFSNGDMMQTLVLGLLMGAAVLGMKDQSKKKAVIDWFESMNNMLFTYVGYVINLAPVGVLFLMADSFGAYGISIFKSMLGILGSFYVAILFQILLVYCTVVWIAGRINPIRFIRDSSEVWMFTIATCSSTANIPIGLRVAKEKFKVPERVADFCIPLGAQVNYDGSAIFYGVMLIAVYQMYGIPYTLGMMFQMVIVASLISSSGGGLPGGALVKLLVVMEAFSLPIEIVGIVAGFFRFFDMGSTMCNCLGDLAGTVAVGRSEDRRAKRLGVELDETGFDKL